MLTVKKILAGRGAVDYYLNQTRRGLADYYLPDERAAERDGDGAAAGLSAPGPGPRGPRHRSDTNVSTNPSTGIVPGH